MSSASVAAWAQKSLTQCPCTVTAAMTRTSAAQVRL